MEQSVEGGEYSARMRTKAAPSADGRRLTTASPARGRRTRLPSREQDAARGFHELDLLVAMALPSEPFPGDPEGMRRRLYGEGGRKRLPTICARPGRTGSRTPRNLSLSHALPRESEVRHDPSAIRPLPIVPALPPRGDVPRGRPCRALRSSLGPEADHHRPRWRRRVRAELGRTPWSEPPGSGGPGGSGFAARASLVSFPQGTTSHGAG